MLKQWMYTFLDVREIHVVADRYDGLFGYRDAAGNHVSLKDSSGCHEHRGANARAQILLGRNTKLFNWTSILASSKTKSQLLEVLFEICEGSVDLVKQGVTLYLSGGFSDRMKVAKLPANVSAEDYKERLSSDHEEADTRIILHVLDALGRNFKEIAVLANDTDIVVGLLYHCCQLYEKKELVDRAIYVNFQKYSVPIHQLCEVLPNSLLSCLPVVHCVTGCDTVSYFYGKGKKSAMKAVERWNLYEDIRNVIVRLRCDDAHAVLEEFTSACRKVVVAMYGKDPGDFRSLNDLRIHLYPRKRELKYLPPTDDAFSFHAMRSLLQVKFLLEANLPRPSPVDPTRFGWTFSKGKICPVPMGGDPFPQGTSPEYCLCRTCSRACPCVDKNRGCDLLCQCAGKCNESADESSEDEF